MQKPLTLVGIGEALYDVFGRDYRLGGAPLNAACHAHQLLAHVGGRGVLVSRVGQDALGDQLRADLRARGMPTGYIQTDPDRPTGRVFVKTDAQGRPTYDIPADSAWDMLWFDPEDEDLATEADAVCFGTLAQRDAQTRNSLYRFLETARTAVKLLDVNLRPPFYDRRILERSLDHANAAKLNTDELAELHGMFGLGDDDADPVARCQALRTRFDLEMVALTRGEQGTALVTAAGVPQGEPAAYPAAGNADPVGAGDACAAALMVGLSLRMDEQATADLANHAGAYVASQPGATPKLPEAIVDRVR